MKLLSLFAPARPLTLALLALAVLAVLGFTRPAPARAEAGVITAKTWIDPANGHAAVGDGVADDTQNLQDMINSVLNQGQNNNKRVNAIRLEPGTYRITKTLLVQITPTNAQYAGLHISGMAGPNRSMWNPIGGVAIVLDAASTTQPAVLEIGSGAFYDTVIENMNLQSLVPNSLAHVGTKYGLYFAEQHFTHVMVRNVTVANVGTAFANVQGTTGGGNGEEIDLDECIVSNVNCFYWNNSGQSLVHKINNCSFYINNGGVAIKVGDGSLGFDLDAFTLCGTFISGPLRNTFVENDGISGCVNVIGGRIEYADTLLDYSGGAPQINGHVTMKGIEFTASNTCFSPTHAVIAKTFPLVDDTLHGTLVKNAEQYSNTFEDLVINTDLIGWSPPITTFPTLTLTALIGDNSRNHFVRCDFTGFSNKLTDAGGTPSTFWDSATTNKSVSNQAALTALHATLTDCRAATGGNSVFVNIP